MCVFICIYGRLMFWEQHPGEENTYVPCCFIFGGVYRVGVWRLQAFLMWRLASRGNISWRLASTELEASASTDFFEEASGVQRKYFPASSVYRFRSVRVRVPKVLFRPTQLNSMSPQPISHFHVR